MVEFLSDQINSSEMQKNILRENNRIFYHSTRINNAAHYECNKQGAKWDNHKINNK